MFDYTKISDILLKLQGSLSHFANILQFFLQLSRSYNFDV